MRDLFDESFKNFREDKDIEKSDPSIILPHSFFMRTKDVMKEKDEEIEKEKDEEIEKEKIDENNNFTEFNKDILEKIQKYNLQNYDLLILDEAHAVRNKGRLFHGIKTLIKNRKKNSKEELRIFMTATPVVNKQEDFETIQELLEYKGVNDENVKVESTKTMQGEANCYDYQLEINMKKFDFGEKEKEIIEYLYTQELGEDANRGYMKRAMASSVDTLIEYCKKVSDERIKMMKDETEDAMAKDSEKEEKSGDDSQEGTRNEVDLKFKQYLEIFNNQNIQELWKSYNGITKNANDDTLGDLLKEIREKHIDSKLAALVELLNDIKSEDEKQTPNKPFKVVIFTWSKNTAKYLEAKLKDSEFLKQIQKKSPEIEFSFDSTAIINGDTCDVISVIDKFEKSNASMALICTEAAREGLNMQFCHNLIHYDFPFTPASICQRNGRIYRRRKEYDESNPRVWYMYSGYGYDVRQYDQIILSKLGIIKELSDKELIVPIEILPDDEILKASLDREFIKEFINITEDIEEGTVQLKIKSLNNAINRMSEDLPADEKSEFNELLKELLPADEKSEFKKVSKIVLVGVMNLYQKLGMNKARKLREKETVIKYKKKYCKQIIKFYKYIGGDEAEIDNIETDAVDDDRKEIFKQCAEYCDSIFSEYIKGKVAKKRIKQENGEMVYKDIEFDDIWYSWQIYSTDGGRKLFKISDDKEVTMKEYSEHHVIWKDRKNE